jgi:prepilin-type N-terminal cleavage/methylation domain-containing protein
VTKTRTACQTIVRRNQSSATYDRVRARTNKTGFSLLELLCVIAIIAILAALLPPVLFKAYNRVKDMADEQEAPTIAHLLKKEIRGYCRANPQFRFASKADLVQKSQLLPKCRAWVEASSTDFVPFDSSTPTNNVVLSVHLGRRQALLYEFTKSDLSKTPEGE